MSIYTRGQSTASRLLAKFSQGSAGSVKLIVRADPVESAEPWDGNAELPVEHDLDATVTGVPFRIVDGTRVLASDLMVTSAVLATGVVPTKDSTIKIGTQEHEIIEFRPVPPVGTTVVWKFIVRG